MAETRIELDKAGLVRNILKSQAMLGRLIGLPLGEDIYQEVVGD